MKRLISLIAFLSITQAQAYDVHEWGTFTSLVGSNGSRQEGMFYEDEILPDFVHNFGRDLTDMSSLPVPVPPVTRPSCRNRKIACEFLEGQSITQKMETPVLYFHSKEAIDASVEVGFPEGIISQTFPAPVLSYPLPVPGVKLINGFARFDVKVLTDDALKLPVVPAGNIYAHARAVDANTIVSNGEAEKFIFYRGLGKFESKLFVTSASGDVTIENSAETTTPEAYLVDTTGTEGAIMSLGAFTRGETKTISARNILALKKEHQPFEAFAKNAKELLTKSLVENGLNLDEALAMVNTWEHGYFHTPGLRVLYILHPLEVENLLPMTITPAPEHLNRVFVGRVEVLRDVEESRLLNEILQKKEAYDVMALGRFAPSIINRIHEVAKERGIMTPSLEEVFLKLNKIISENM